MNLTKVNQLLCSTVRIHKRQMVYGEAGVLNISTLSMIYDVLEIPDISQECRLKLEEIADSIILKDKDICIQRGEDIFFDNPESKIDVSVVTNYPPTVEDYFYDLEPGPYDFSFRKEMFMQGFSDPEGDLPETVRILTVPDAGYMYFKGTRITPGITFSIEDADKLRYDRFQNVYETSFIFQTSDNNSINKLFSNMATFTVNVQGQVNQPPTIGNGSTTTAYNTSFVFTRAMFTSGTTPPYFDPEGDAPLALKITSLPSQGKIKRNGVNITVNEILDFVTIIDAGLLTYVPDPGQTGTQSLDFTFEISDAGSGTFVS